MRTSYPLSYSVAGLLIVGFSGWLISNLVSQLKTNSDYTFLGVPALAWIAILGSIIGSGLFFTISEALRWKFDKEISDNYERLRLYEKDVGIMKFFTQKGGGDARKDYTDAIANARHRVWAFGISNGEFIKDHLERLIEKKARTPKLNVCICFVDPGTKITNKNCGISDLSQVELYDITGNKESDRAPSRVREHVNWAAATVKGSEVEVDIALKFVSTAGYMSAMVVDNAIYVFPFTAAQVDNTRTPYLKVAVKSQMGQALYSFFKNIKDHSQLSRPAS